MEKYIKKLKRRIVRKTIFFSLLWTILPMLATLIMGGAKGGIFSLIVFGILILCEFPVVLILVDYEAKILKEIAFYSDKHHHKRDRNYYIALKHGIVKAKTVFENAVINGNPIKTEDFNDVFMFARKVPWFMLVIFLLGLLCVFLDMLFVLLAGFGFYAFVISIRIKKGLKKEFQRCECEKCKALCSVFRNSDSSKYSRTTESYETKSRDYKTNVGSIYLNSQKVGDVYREGTTTYSRRVDIDYAWFEYKCVFCNSSYKHEEMGRIKKGDWY